MAHNTNKVNNVGPNASGSIPVTIEDLNDVAAGVTDGQTLSYNSTSGDWEPIAMPGSASDQYIIIGRGESDNYSNATASTPSAGQTVYYYDTNPVNTISGASINAVNNWVNSVTLPAGKYVIWAQCLFEFSASGYVVFHVNNATASPFASIGETASSYGFGASTAQAVVNSGSSVTINVRIQAASNVAVLSSQGFTPSQHGSLVIRRVS